MKSSDSDIKSIISRKRQINTFAEKFLPAIFAVRIGRIGRIFSAFRIVRVELIVSDKCTPMKNKKSFLFGLNAVMRYV
jgi:hypothetical protein